MSRNSAPRGDDDAHGFRSMGTQTIFEFELVRQRQWEAAQLASQVEAVPLEVSPEIPPEVPPRVESLMRPQEVALEVFGDAPLPAEPEPAVSHCCCLRIFKRETFEVIAVIVIAMIVIIVWYVTW